VIECLVSPPGFSSFSEPIPLRWRVTYSDLGKMDSKIPMGRSAFLILKPHAQRLLLLDSKEQVISARSLNQDEHVVTGNILDFKDLSVLVGECVGSSVSGSQDHSHIPGSNSHATPRSFVDVVKAPNPANVSALPEAPPVRWKATCSHFQNGSSSSQAFLLLRPQAKRLVLLDMQEEVLDARFLLENEKNTFWFDVGLKISYCGSG
jgi:hypothetical protein